MKKYLLILGILLSNFFCSFSQIIHPNQYEKNLTKYWMYRERLKNEFMIGIGPSQGQSLPASERIRGAGVNDGAKLKWGDCTIMLGQYIGVLAIEMRLLIESGSDYTKTAEELFFALWAFSRLDLAGEPHWGNPPNAASLKCINCKCLFADLRNVYPAAITLI